MTYPGGFLSPPSPRIPLTRSSHVEDYDSSSSTDSTDTARISSPRPRNTFAAASSSTSGATDFLFPVQTTSGRSSVSSTATSTPVPSRSVSPLPQFFASGPPSSCTSDTESDTNSPLLGTRNRYPWWREDRRRWWTMRGPSRRRRRRDVSLLRSVKKFMRRIVRHPLFPRQPITIVMTLLLLTIFAVCLTLLLIHILNPDKEPLPWRAYCSVPSSSSPPDYFTTTTPPTYSSTPASGLMPAPFPPVNLDSLSPAGLLIGVFSMDSAFERRMLVRTTWASHPRSRYGAGEGDDGDATSRTVVRFILGQPRKNWERRIKLEIELYNDIIILPVGENMNSGKTHSFFSWASEDAWVPPVYFNTSVPSPKFSYSNSSSPPPPLAPHDPNHAWRERSLGMQTPWVRPDFIVKVDDDSFVMLAELEARLRLELHSKSQNLDDPSYPSTSLNVPHESSPSGVNSSNPALLLSSVHVHDHSAHETRTPPPSSSPPSQNDPLVYWGYLVKNTFMAGELYALSWSLAHWVANDPTVKGMTRGAEDKQTAKWMRLHPRASEVRWTSERCWIYDHPRAATVYSHGFLFPSEVTRVKRGIVSYPDKTPQDVLSTTASPWTPSVGTNSPTPAAWAHSSVTTFGQRYQPPVMDLSPSQSIEALVEGSDMSMISEGSPMTPEYAWLHREGRKKRYEGKRVGGTVVIHFIKKHMWFLETALAMLEGEEASEFEKFELRKEIETATGQAAAAMDYSALSRAISKHRRR